MADIMQSAKVLPPPLTMSSDELESYLKKGLCDHKGSFAVKTRMTMLMKESTPGHYSVVLPNICLADNFECTLRGALPQRVQVPKNHVVCITGEPGKHVLLSFDAYLFDSKKALIPESSNMVIDIPHPFRLKPDNRITIHLNESEPFQNIQDKTIQHISFENLPYAFFGFEVEINGFLVYSVRREYFNEYMNYVNIPNQALKSTKFHFYYDVSKIDKQYPKIDGMSGHIVEYVQPMDYMCTLPRMILQLSEKSNQILTEHMFKSVKYFHPSSLTSFYIDHLKIRPVNHESLDEVLKRGQAFLGEYTNYLKVVRGHVTVMYEVH